MADEMAEPVPVSGVPLPASVLSIVFRFLSARPDSINAHLVCKEWRDVLQKNPAVQRWFHLQLLKEYAPRCAALPPVSANDGSDLKRLYLQYRNLVEIGIPELWSPSNKTSDSDNNNTFFRESMRTGKYSRWTLAPKFDNPSFIVNLAWAVRVLYCLGPNGYNVVDGAEYFPYDPRHSMRASNTAPGWRLISTHTPLPDDILPQLLFDETEFAGLAMLKHVSRGGSNAVDHILEQHPDLVHHPQWSRAMDLSQHIRLLQFLVTEPSALRGLFWDTDGVTCRNVFHMARAHHPLWWKEERQHVQEYNYYRHMVATPNPRQLPHLFNMFKLAKHVEELEAAKKTG